MPLGIERINARRQQPNPRIVFIKPLEGPDKELAQDFLERIAAICKPIMVANHLSVMSLEEHEPNLEFVGRNFNAGEVIQLVLKAPYTGHWLPFRHVQMVMMHELAHCNAMHHGAGFWKLRNQYAAELRELWGKSYTGDGFWGRGRTVLSERYETTRLAADEFVPRSLCGGTYRSSRRRKRKRGDKSHKPELSYAERRQRRIAKKFGTNGVELGGDDDARRYLEFGKRHVGKPRVAGSNRGRELRAAAALERFKQQKTDEVKQEEQETSTESETESEYDEVEIKEEVLDTDGKKMVDAKGRSLVKVCAEEDEADEDAQKEMRELEQVDQDTSAADDESTASESETHSRSKQPMGADSRKSDPITQKPPSAKLTPAQKSTAGNGQSTLHAAKLGKATSEADGGIGPLTIDCPICSMKNESVAQTCIACSHVLDVTKVPNHWRCQSAMCRGGNYVNAADCGLCGVCGARKSASEE